jgi:hypothetical protein
LGSRALRVLAELLEQPPGVPPVASGMATHRAGASATRPNLGGDAGAYWLISRKLLLAGRFVRDESLRRRTDALPLERGSTFELPERLESDRPWR